MSSINAYLQFLGEVDVSTLKVNDHLQSLRQVTNHVEA